jgi:hypothetical protein
MKARWAVIGVLGLAAASCAAAQQKGDVFYRTGGAVVGVAEKVSRTPVLNAPYTATITNESVQILADGNRITQSSSGTTARDSQGRLRQDAPLPAIGNMAASNAPHFVFIMDPVAGKTYTLNLTEKTARSFDMSGAIGGDGVVVSGSAPGEGQVAVAAGAPLGETFSVQMENAAPMAEPMMDVAKAVSINEQGKLATINAAAQVSTEDLGTQTMEGVLVTGTRTTRTIPAGRIGNEKPISIVIEVWTSPELKTVVMSKRSDPRMGEQTFRLTNIVRAEPDPSLFAVPADFRLTDGEQPVMYRMKQ